MKQKITKWLLLFACINLFIFATACNNTTESLQFQQIDGKQEYCVVGVGNVSSKDITIPSTYNGLPITSIGDEAFYECTHLTSITIPDSVTSIGDNAFQFCNFLTQVTIPDSVISIGSMAFANCSRLTNTTLPNSVTKIGNRAFWDCNSLTKVILPDSVTNIGHYAFGGCDRLFKVYIPSSVITVGKRVFAYSLCLNTIHCEVESKPDGWHDDWNKKYSELDDDIVVFDVEWGYTGNN